MAEIRNTMNTTQKIETVIAGKTLTYETGLLARQAAAMPE